MAEINYAKRHHQRRQGNHLGRPRNLSTEQRLTMQVQILADRLAVAYTYFVDHPHFDENPVPIEVIDWLDAAGVDLLEVERDGRFDDRRTRQAHTYATNRLRTMLREQVSEDKASGDG